jgi:hypothetical protein
MRIDWVLHFILRTSQISEVALTAALETKTGERNAMKWKRNRYKINVFVEKGHEKKSEI